ncbi:MAG: proline racemase family protein [Pseudomonadota bacterium]
MRSDRLIHVVGCHAEGEVGDVVTGGVAPPPGETLWEQSRYLAQNTELKDFLLHEPRGGVFRHVNLLVPPKHPDADIAAIIMEPESVPPMSGSNSICVVTVALETGRVPMREPVTELMLEMPGGLIKVRAECAAGKVERVSFENIASFADELGVTLEVAGHASVRADTAFGGDSFVVVSAADLGFSLDASEASDLTAVGMAIAAAAQEQIGFSHPDLPGFNDITFCLLAGPVQQSATGLSSTHAVAIKPGKLDRSPTGTGASARLALMHARGDARVGTQVLFRSVLGSEFRADIVRETRVGTKPAVIPRVSGRAWITGTSQLMLDPSDPWPTGYRLSDTWPRMPGDQ